MRPIRSNPTLLAVIFFAALLQQSASAFLFWTAERNDTRIHVLAKVELPSSDTEALAAEAIKDAFEKSDVILFESQLNPELHKQDQQRIVQAALYPSGDILTRHLPDDLARTFMAISEKYSLKNNLVLVKPWAAGYRLNQVVTEKSSVGEPGFIDHHLFKLAAASGKSADFLTTADEFIALYALLPKAEQISIFKQYVSSEAGKADYLKSLADAWRAGDADAAAGLVNKSYESYENVREKTVGKQNLEWAKKINGMTRFDENIFVVVPIENAVGSSNFLDALKSEGFTVTKVSAK